MLKKTACGAMAWALAMALVGWAAEAAQGTDCLAAPEGTASKGLHWYYRLDHANNRKCWYLASLRTRPAFQPKTRQAESRTASRAQQEFAGSAFWGIPGVAGAGSAL